MRVTSSWAPALVSAYATPARVANYWLLTICQQDSWRRGTVIFFPASRHIPGSRPTACAEWEREIFDISEEKETKINENDTRVETRARKRIQGPQKEGFDVTSRFAKRE